MDADDAAEGREHRPDGARTPGADASKLLTAYVSPAKDITILGLDTRRRLDRRRTTNAPVSYSVGGLPPNTFFRLLVWNGDGAGVNVDEGFFASDAGGHGRVLGSRSTPCSH